MLIELASALPGAEKSLLGLPLFWQCIDRLAQAHRDGNHLLQIDAHCCAWLLRNRDRISAPSVAVIQEIQRSARTNAAALSQIGERIVVTERSHGAPRVAGESIEVPCTWFSTTDRVGSTMLIAEDVKSDVILYQRLAEALAHTQGLGFRVRITGGGGSRIGPELAAQTTNASPAIAIVDTDRTHPGGAIGTTCRTAWRSAQDVGARCDPPPSANMQTGHEEAKGLGRLVILNARELENLIPSSAWEEIPISPLPELLRLNETEWVWLDRKAGILCMDTLGHTEQARYLRAALNKSGKAAPCQPSGACQRAEEERCGAKDSGKAPAKLLDGLPNGALLRLAGVLPQWRHETIRERLLPSGSGELARVGSIIMAWGLAGVSTARAA